MLIFGGCKDKSNGLANDSGIIKYRYLFSDGAGYDPQYLHYVYLEGYTMKKDDAVRRLIEFSYCYMQNIGAKHGKTPIGGISFINSLKPMNNFLWNHDNINWARIEKHTLLSIFFEVGDSNFKVKKIKYYNKNKSFIISSDEIEPDTFSEIDCVSRIKKQYIHIDCPKGYHCLN